MTFAYDGCLRGMRGRGGWGACGYLVIFNEGEGDLGDLILSTVKTVESANGLVAFFCLRLLSAGSFCSLIRMDDLRVSDSSRGTFSRLGLGRDTVRSVLRFSASESVVFSRESLEYECRNLVSFRTRCVGFSEARPAS